MCVATVLVLHSFSFYNQLLSLSSHYRFRVARFVVASIRVL